MRPTAAIIAQPSIDFSTLTRVAMQALGRSITTAVDTAGRKMHDTEKFLSCLSSIRGNNSTGLPDELLPHCCFTALIMCDQGDTLAVLEAASGMPFTFKETVMRGIDLIILSGTLRQWRDVVVIGSECDDAVRTLYAAIRDQFRSLNLDLWRGWDQQSDGRLIVRR
jgi:hypothetical protein